MVKGEVVYKNGDEYCGELGKNNSLEGHGTYKFKDGSQYIGSFKNNKFNGKGKLIDMFQDLVINAEFKDGKAEGWGRITYGGTHKYDSQTKNSETTQIRGQYEGDLKNGYRHGKGKYIFHNKNNQEVHPLSYDGLFEEDAFHGNGKLIFSDKSCYNGNFQQNLYNGYGEYSTSQFLYSGDFKKGIIQGQGIMKYPSGEFYQGSFCNGLKEGHGQYHYLDEQGKQRCSYIGQWKNDQKHGKGKLVMKNGDSYHGQFVDDKPYGQFKCVIDAVQVLAEIEGELLNGPIRMLSGKSSYQLNGNYANGIKNGVFIMQKTNKYGEKVSYRGQFKNGQQLPYSVSYSHRF